MKKGSYILITLLFLAGLGVMLYPTISSWYNGKFQIQAIIDYDDSLALLSDEHKETQRREAEAYNQALTGSGLKDPFIEGSGMVLPDNYTSILDVSNGVMGYITIPRIDVQLPVYHGTGEDVLKKGVGHMEMTAFPIGGKGNHSVLTGHTGLPDAILFTNLVKLENGDKFYISVLGETLAYEVDKITVVEPSDTSQLQTAAGEDYITLVTCTPYGINSHRLLVRGTRIPYVEETDEEVVEIHADSLQEWIPYIAVGSVALMILAGTMVFFKIRGRRR